MSSMERNKGKLIPITESLESLAERLVSDDDISGTDSTKLDALLDDLYWFGREESIYLIDNKPYKAVFEVKGATDNYYGFVEVDDDPLTGEISFHTMHYNGGGDWVEAVENDLLYGDL